MLLFLNLIFFSSFFFSVFFSPSSLLRFVLFFKWEEEEEVETVKQLEAGQQTPNLVLVKRKLRAEEEKKV